MRGRREHATDRRAVARVCVGIEHEIGDAGRAAGVERLLETSRVEPGANCVRADDGDGLAVVARRGNEARGLTRGVDLDWVGGVHSCLLGQKVIGNYIIIYLTKHSL